MIFIRMNTENMVTLVHHMPFDEKYGLHKTESELLEEGYLIDKIPDPENRDGYTPVMMYQPDVGIYYDYTEMPPQEPTPDERIAILEAENAEMKAELVALTEAIERGLA